jgi:branched-chain amino acid transport system ATP-binding protein
MLDEPANGLTLGEVHELGDLLQALRAEFELTILLVEHHMGLVMSLCDRIAVLNFGSLIAVGTPSAIKADPRVIQAYLGGVSDSAAGA